MIACQPDFTPVPTADDEAGSSDSTSTTSSDESTESESDESQSESTDSTDDTGEPMPECGNGIVEGDEECDDANPIDSDACTNACTAPACGDGIVQRGEACDAGPDNGRGNACNSMCQPNVCGDGVIGPGEACDDGNLDDADACTNACALASCGDGLVQPPEPCDDGNAVNDDGCLNTCVLPSCGDEVLFAELEECDLGPQNADGAACTSACTLASCGDGLVWIDVEECDLGQDNGPNSACLDDCVTNVCGDGFEGPGEACDDGNMIDADGCTNACGLPGCGDGVLQPGEECDQGEANGADAACTPECEHAECGDGYAYVGGGEQCDDGNDIEWDACTDDCALPFCGDGIWSFDEECDDGDQVSNDGCSNCIVEPTVTELSTGEAHTCILHDGAGNVDASVRCWGEGVDGRLGYGSELSVGDDEHPRAAGDVDVGGYVVELSAGAAHTCVTIAANPGRRARCWGKGEHGRLGYGNVEDIGDDEAPSVAGDIDLGGSVVQISAGGSHTCALIQGAQGHRVRCWGNGADGRLGYGNVEDIGDDETPVAAGYVELGGWVSQVSAGEAHTCARLDSGEVYCWGRGLDGRLGYGNTQNVGDDELPLSVGPVPLDNANGIHWISAGGRHTCAVDAIAGEVMCWGLGLDGRLGHGNELSIGDDEPAFSVGPVPSVVSGWVDVGGAHSCAMVGDSELRCWGTGSEGRLGHGNVADIGDDEVPAGNVMIAGPNWAYSFDTGGAHTCALGWGQDGVRCWGRGDEGQLGYANAQDIGDDELPIVAGVVQVF